MENREVCTDYYLNSAIKFGFEGSMIDPNSNFTFLVYAERDKEPIFDIVITFINLSIIRHN